MPQLDFNSPRLFVDAALAPGESVALDRNANESLLMEALMVALSGMEE